MFILHSSFCSSTAIDQMNPARLSLRARNQVAADPMKEPGHC